MNQGPDSHARERPIPLAENQRARMLLAELRRGPRSTLQLQAGLPLVHVARQVWELRHWYGMKIKTGRQPNGVAVYSLVEEPPSGPLCPKCGNSLVNVDLALDPRFVVGTCRIDGRQMARIPGQ